MGQPLAGQLIESARNKRVIDLSVLLADNHPVWWPGRGVGNNRHPYLRNIIPPYGMKLHHLDSHTGTHLVPPAYALPPPGFDNQTYAPEVRQWLAAYERRFGKRGTSRVTTEQVPLSQTCGWARVIDVQHLIGTTSKEQWPASPEITPKDIQEYEAKHGPLKSGEIVIFRSGYSDRYFKPFPEGDRFMADPLNGRSEGWPAPGPEAVVYLAEKRDPLRRHRRSHLGRRRAPPGLDDLLGAGEPRAGGGRILDRARRGAAASLLHLRTHQDP